jgi:SAM-dependent methyltransferase
MQNSTTEKPPSLLNNTMHIIRKEGILPLFREAIIRITGQKPLMQFDELKHYFCGKRGLEIGGPSRIFAGRSLMPIYSVVASCDNCNFSHNTVWQGNVKEGMTFRYHSKKPAGYQFIRDACNLTGINSESYDFVISSDLIEHLPNPVKAMYEWKRVLRTNGIIITVAPHKERTFDHGRPITTLNHLIDDYTKGLTEDDLSHLPEILRLHDLSRDPKAGSYEQFLARSKRNFENRCLHHHVFITESLITMYDYINLGIVHISAALPVHIIAIGKKVIENAENLNSLHAANAQLLSRHARWRQQSPFRLDKSSDGSND